MSGHSKWASIKHKKYAADAKRGKVFSKMAKQIAVAVKEGSADFGMNFSLRLLVDKAKKVNMPKDVIERAIQKGSGTGGEGAMYSAIYEAMGPGGSAIIIETLTDNTNRTLGNVKTIVTKKGGNFGAKIAWMFDQKGVIRVPGINVEKPKDELELALIDAGAEDIQYDEDSFVVYTAVPDLKNVIDALTALDIDAGDAGIEFVAKDSLELSDSDSAKLFDLIEVIEEDDDVSNVYTNV